MNSIYFRSASPFWNSATFYPFVNSNKLSRVLTSIAQYSQIALSIREKILYAKNRGTISKKLKTLSQIEGHHSHKVDVLQSSYPLFSVFKTCNTARQSFYSSPQISDPKKSFFDEVDRDWDKAWKNQVTPWDVGSPAPPLVSLLREEIITPNMTPEKSKVLIPGCGTGYELIAFAKAGFDHVEGVDISSTAIEVAETKLEQIIDSDSSLSDESKNDVRKRISLRVGDFFALKDTYNVIFDYTFCVALPPKMRLQWGNQVKNLLDPETGELITLIFPVPSEHNTVNSDYNKLDILNGPPYDASPSLYTYLLGKENNMECIDLRPCLDSIKPRQGKEWIGRWKINS